MHFSKKGQKIWAWVDPPPLFGQCLKENVFFPLTPSLIPASLSMIVIHDVNTFDCTVSVAGPSINLVRKKAIQLLRHLFVVKKEQPSFSAVVLFSESYILA